jgi:hypothetical protein
LLSGVTVNGNKDQEKNKLAALASNLVTALEVVVQVAPETDS